MLLQALGSNSIIEGCEMGKNFDTDTFSEILNSYKGDARELYWREKRLCYGQTPASEIQRILEEKGQTDK